MMPVRVSYTGIKVIRRLHEETVKGPFILIGIPYWIG